MQQEEKLKYLKIALYVFGVVFIIGVPAMMMVIWPSGWIWSPVQPEYAQIIMEIYITLGVFLIRAVKDPMANLSIISPALRQRAFYVQCYATSLQSKCTGYLARLLTTTVPANLSCNPCFFLSMPTPIKQSSKGIAER